MNFKNVCYCHLLFCIVFACNCILAAPHNGDEFNLRQPDGRYVVVKVWGDEFYQRVESIDGYTLIRDPENSWIWMVTFL